MIISFSSKHHKMIPNLTILQILLFISIVSCDFGRDRKGRRKSNPANKILWKQEYEDELTDAMLSTKKRENNTRVPQSTDSMDNEVVMEKLVDSITSSDKYLTKVDGIDFRLNRLDIELHEKTNSILAQLSDIAKVVQSGRSADKVEHNLNMLKEQLRDIKMSMEKNAAAARSHSNAGDNEYHMDVALDTRLTALESSMKSIHSGVDSIVSTIAEVKNRQYNKSYQKSEGTVSDSLTLINEFRKSLHDQRFKKCDCSLPARVDRAERYPTDCHEIQMQGFNVSGIYKIRPDYMNPFYVLCDLTTAGGGWTVFQNRFDGSQDFYKSWNDYEYGFGNLAGEFWLGLDKLNYLTNQKLYELRIELECQNGQDAYAGYSVFTIGPQHEGYRISTLGNFYGTAGDSLSYHAGQKFSTFDVDNDEWHDGACAVEHGGAWWYKECDKSNLNGKYGTTGQDAKGSSIYWISFKGPNIPLAKTKMMIRPLPASKPIDYSEADRKPADGKSLKIIPEKLRHNMIEKVIGARSKNKGLYDQRLRAHYAYDDTQRDVFFPNYA